MNYIKTFIAVAIFLILSIPNKNVTAQIKPGTFTVAPHIGWYVFDGDQDTSHAPVHGMGIGYNYNKHLGVEGTFDYIFSDSKPSDNDIRVYTYRLDGLYHFMPDKEFVPYLSGGIGGLSLNEKNNGTDTNAILNYGAGLKGFITESLTIRGDIRHIFDLDDSNHNFAYTIGLTYFFGKKEKKAPPPPMPPGDSDSDGVSDDLDKCPDTLLGVSVDRSGCPIDIDRDGVYDYKDKCPDTPPGVPVDSDGCPIDSDGDGVYDYKDKCPDTPPGLLVDEAGCRVLVKETVSIELKVEFEFDRADVKNMYSDHLRKVSKFLKTHPGTEAVIEGHTCNIGTEQYNLGLSQRRAENVMRHLINDGVEPSRLSSKAYGESMPIADNSTEEGRRQNRRVNAVISTIVTNVIKK